MTVATTIQTFSRIDRYPGRELSITVKNRTYVQRAVLVTVVYTHKVS